MGVDARLMIRWCHCTKKNLNELTRQMVRYLDLIKINDLFNELKHILFYNCAIAILNVLIEGEDMEFLNTIELNYNDLRACNLFRATNDVRFYLCGVYVGQGGVVATDGHRLLVCDEPEAESLDLIIPGEVIKSLIAKVGRNPKIKKVLLHQVKDSKYWLLDHIGSYELFIPIDGKFPEWKRVDMPKPEKYTAESFPQFNFDYLNDFLKVARIYGNVISQPKLFPTTASERCYVEINERVHGVIMPMRT